MILAQQHLGNTNSKKLYQTPRNTDTEIRSIHICNVTSSAVTYRVFVNPNGTTYNTGNAIFYDVSLGANETELIEYGENNFTIGRNATIGARCDTANSITITISGFKK